MRLCPFVPIAQDVFGIELPDHRAAVRSAAARGAVTLLGSASPEEVRGKESI